MHRTTAYSRLAAALFLAGSGCTSHVTTWAGRDGNPLPPHASVSLAQLPVPAGALAGLGREAVTAELVRHGFAPSADGATRLDIALAQRPAFIGVADAHGHDLSIGRKRGFLRSCHRQTQRLSITAIDDRQQVTRAWAEERHCHGDPAASIGPLAAQAVAMLAGEGRSRTRRAGRD